MVFACRNVQYVLTAFASVIKQSVKIHRPLVYPYNIVRDIL